MLFRVTANLHLDEVTCVKHEIVQKNETMMEYNLFSFRCMCNMQEKLIIQYSVQWGQISFFFSAKQPTLFIHK